VIRRVDLSDFELPGLAPYLTMRRSVEHEREGIFVAEGGSVVERLLGSGLEVRSALLSPRWFEVLEPTLEAREEQLEVFVAPEHLLSSIVGFNLHQGVLAVAAVPRPPPLADVLASARRPRLVVALDGVANAENLGVVARNCAAFAVTAVVAGERSSSPWLRRAVRVSMGTVFGLSVHRVGSLVDALALLREEGFVTVAAAPDGDPADRADLGGDTCLVLGHEDRGVRAAVRAACDLVLAIPMPGGVDSLNVASASAVLLYEVRRQQGNRSRFDCARGRG